ncbi:MAG: hypothetical protein J7L51_04055 [Desulfurococcales archaeon]|nr:hypothetical protein [Desulfurococcales archaeon]
MNSVNPFDGDTDFSIVVTFRTEEPGILISSARDSAVENHSMAFFVGEDWASYDNFEVGGAAIEDVYPIDGEWHTIVTIYDAEEEFHLTYLDGVAGFEEWFDPNIPDAHLDTIRIGNSLNTEFPAGEGIAQFYGDINDVTVYDIALTYEQVLSVSGIDSVEILPDGNVYEDAGGVTDQIINLKDYAVVGDEWLVESLWP